MPLFLNSGFRPVASSTPLLLLKLCTVGFILLCRSLSSAPGLAQQRSSVRPRRGVARQPSLSAPLAVEAPREERILCNNMAAVTASSPAPSRPRRALRADPGLCCHKSIGNQTQTKAGGFGSTDLTDRAKDGKSEDAGGHAFGRHGGRGGVLPRRDVLELPGPPALRLDAFSSLRRGARGGFFGPVFFHQGRRGRGPSRSDEEGERGGQQQQQEEEGLLHRERQQARVARLDQQASVR